MQKKTYITNAIPYVNDVPHIGFSLEIVQSDTLARFYRLLDYETYYLAGTDENAIKNVEAAEKNGISVQKLVDQNSQAFLNLKQTLNLSFDQFIRTSSSKHKQGAQKLWRLCQKDIYKKNYEGLYCIGCETFYDDKEFKSNICPLHNRPLELVSEENYFFKLSKYQSRLEKLIEKDELKIYPEYRKKEVFNFIKSGLKDFSISRPVERAKNWGVPVPNDDTQIMYVWFDALTNYISALDFDSEGELFKKFWIENSNRFHVIGKDIIKFHAIYWPAILLSAELPPPTKLFVHGFISIEGKRMSKSLGNVIHPETLVKKYGTDAVRYYLLREIPSLDDGNYSEQRFKEVYNADLANGLGNLVARITNLCEQNNITLEEHRPEFPSSSDIGGFKEHLESFQFNEALEELWRDIKALDVEINEKKPWDLPREIVSGYLKEWIKRIRNIAYSLQPFLPTTSTVILSKTQGKIKKIPPLFPRI